MTQLLIDNVNSVIKMRYPEDEESSNNLDQTSNTRMNIIRFIQTAGVAVTALLAPSIENPTHPYFSYSNQNHKLNNDVVKVYDYSYTMTNPNYDVVSIDTRQEAIGTLPNKIEFDQFERVYDFSYEPQPRKIFELPDEMVIVKGLKPEYLYSTDDVITDEIVYEAKPKRTFEL